jgi:hypothetical protein
MKRARIPAKLSPFAADAMTKDADTIIDTQVDVLHFWSEGIAGGNFALGELPKVCKLKALPAWVAAWSLLSVACLGLRANSTALGWRETYPMVPLIELD